MTLPTLTVGVVRLREFTIGDTDALHRVYGDPVATRHLSFDPRSREQVADVLAGIIARRQGEPRTEYALAVERLSGEPGGRPLRGAAAGAPHLGTEVVPPRGEMLTPGPAQGPAGGDMIGMARLALGDHRSGQVGFALRPDQWRRGLGRQTVYLLLELAFEHLGLHRVWGARAPENEASRRVMLSLGMVEEGRIRDHIPAPGGWRDSVVHSILEEEWRARGHALRPAAAYADPGGAAFTSSRGSGSGLPSPGTPPLPETLHGEGGQANGAATPHQWNGCCTAGGTGTSCGRGPDLRFVAARGLDRAWLPPECRTTL